MLVFVDHLEVEEGYLSFMKTRLGLILTNPGLILRPLVNLRF